MNRRTSIHLMHRLTSPGGILPSLNSRLYMPYITRCVLADTISHSSFATLSLYSMYSRSTGSITGSDDLSASNSNSSISAIRGYSLHRLCPGRTLSKIRNNIVFQTTPVEWACLLVSGRPFCTESIVLGGSGCACMSGQDDECPTTLVNHSLKRYGII